VPYTEQTLVANIEPEIVTYDNGIFTVPHGVEEFSFTDNDLLWVFVYENEEWVLHEYVEYP
jgi:hypothetical protein